MRRMAVVALCALFVLGSHQEVRISNNLGGLGTLLQRGAAHTPEVHRQCRAVFPPKFVSAAHKLIKPLRRQFELVDVTCTALESRPNLLTSIYEGFMPTNTERVGEQMLLQFVEDSQMQNASNGCTYLLSMLALLSLLMLLYFLGSNSWFFFGLMPSEVPTASRLSYRSGQWAFVLVSFFAFASGICATWSNEPCYVYHTVGHMMMLPAVLLMLWGVLESLFEYENAKVKKLHSGGDAEGDDGDSPASLPINPDRYTPVSQFTVYEPYVWRLNTFPSQTEAGVAPVAASDSGKQHDESALPSDTIPMSQSQVALVSSAVSLNTSELIKMMFGHSYRAVMGIGLIIASVFFAAFSCN